MEYTKENYEKAKSGDVFDFVCPVCGGVFHKTKRQISKNSGIVPIYCSQKCSRIAHEAKIVSVVCKECGKEYYIDKCEYDKKIRNGSEFFCSKSCSAKYNNRKYPKREKTSTEEKCPICGEKKSRCSAMCNDCRKKEKTNFVRSKELGYYIGYEKKYTYVTRRCTEIRKDARKFMDENKDVEKVCAYCHNHEFDDILEVHHIKGITEFEPHTLISEINSKENLVWLCPNHHKMVEKGLIDLNGRLV